MALIDKETIRAEIERLIDEYTDIVIDSRYGTVYAHHVVADLEHLLSSLDTLQEQPVEGLEEEIDKYIQPIQAWEIQETPFISLENCARHFAEWGERHAKKLSDE